MQKYIKRYIYNFVIYFTEPNMETEPKTLARRRLVLFSFTKHKCSFDCWNFVGATWKYREEIGLKTSVSSLFRKWCESLLKDIQQSLCETASRRGQKELRRDRKSNFLAQGKLFFPFFSLFLLEQCVTEDQSWHCSHPALEIYVWMSYPNIFGSPWRETGAFGCNLSDLF